MYVSNDIGEQFLKAVERCLKSDPALRKIVNRNTIKVSYKCGPNLDKIIKGHNKNVLAKHREDLGLPNVKVVKRIRRLD